MNTKLHNALLILATLPGYLEWGHGQHMVIGIFEWELLMKLFDNPGSVFHPMIVLPLAGQVALIGTLFQRVPSRWVSLIAITSISLLFLFILFAGILSQNVKIIFSVLPFLTLSALRIYWKK